ncbi:MAG: hypothetical protein PVF70_11110 [Anaerolineales bacterium]|jgi:hypothetical protein
MVKKKRWEKPRLIVLLRPTSGEGIHVLQNCKNWGLTGPDRDHCLIPDTEFICETIAGS